MFQFRFYYVEVIFCSFLNQNSINLSPPSLVFVLQIEKHIVLPLIKDFTVRWMDTLTQYTVILRIY